MLLHRVLGVLAITMALAGCQAVALPGPNEPSPLPTSSPPTPSPVVATVTLNASDQPNWDTALANAVCPGGTTKFVGGGYQTYKHVAIWLQGASQHFFPDMSLENGRIPGAVLLGESDVVDGQISFTTQFGPRIGPTESGGTMPLAPGNQYAWIIVGDGKGSSYQSFTMPAAACLSADTTPRLVLSPTTVCSNTPTALSGDGFEPGPISVQLWKIYQPGPGEIVTGKGPPEEHTLGQTQADASGHFSFAWIAGVVPGGKYRLRVFDRGRTRLTTLDMPVCAP